MTQLPPERRRPADPPTTTGSTPNAPLTRRELRAQQRAAAEEQARQDAGQDAAAQGEPTGGVDPRGYDERTYDRAGYDQRGYDQAGFDQRGYDQRGNDQAGFDQGGYGQRGYDRAGYDQGGYDRAGYDQGGYDRAGYDQRGYDGAGYDRQGYDQQGHDQAAYDEHGGYDQRGYERGGYDRREYDDRRYGAARDQRGYDQQRYDEHGYDAEYDRTARDDRRVADQAVGSPGRTGREDHFTGIGATPAVSGDPRYDAYARDDATAPGEESIRPATSPGMISSADPHGEDPFADLIDDGTRPSRSDRRAVSSWELEEQEREPNRRRRGAWGCLIALLVLGALVAGAAFVLQGPITSLVERFQPPEDYTGSGTGEVVFMINEGDGGEAIAANLEGQDIVASGDAFIAAVTDRSPEPTFYPGAYAMANQMSAEAALDALLDPENKLENTFVIQEGLWARDALAAASTATGIPIEDLQAAAADPQALGLPEQATSVEGFLFPATYTFPPDVSAEEVVQTLVDRSFQSLDDAGVAPEDRWQTVVIASLIEREAGSEADAYKVSRVIRNRLDPDQFPSQLLQFDSTVHYGTGDDSLVTTTDAERADESNPYNTYVHPGLPPGPIGNPGDVAIDAARNPADGPWLYFVTVNLETGETVFSATLEEHEAAVQRFLQYLDENG
ncbi:endolytic transglycosylase MltG [Agromyces sp. SYSU T0242]|uniref:endolytic transglycosylase MltG n=1 Tax=Agromyces litoreus TaxID=3158561 RepID=UPI00339676AA